MLFDFLFFPGMVFHEVSHFLACIFLGVKVKKVRFFSVRGGFVLHDATGAWKAIIITLAPFILGNYFGLLLLRTGNQLLFVFPFLSVLFLWFGLSLVVFSFPSFQDAKNSFESFNAFYSKKLAGRGSMPWKIFWLFTVPFVYIPLTLTLGVLLSFVYSSILRYMWIIFVLAAVFSPAYLGEAVGLANYFAGFAVQLFIG